MTVKADCEGPFANFVPTFYKIEKLDKIYFNAAAVDVVLRVELFSASGDRS